MVLAILWGEVAKLHVLAYQVLTFTNVRVFSKLKNKTRFYTGNFAPEAPFGTRGVGRMRKRDLSGPFRPLVGPGEARNATGTVTVTGTQAGATFAEGSLKTLRIKRPHVPPLCQATPRRHSQLVCLIGLSMRRRSRNCSREALQHRNYPGSRPFPEGWLGTESS